MAYPAQAVAGPVIVGTGIGLTITARVPVGPVEQALVGVTVTLPDTAVVE